MLVVVPDDDASAKQEHGFIERDTERMTKIGVMIVVAWAGELLAVMPGTEVLIGEDLLEGHSWAIGVMLLSAQLEWNCFSVCVPKLYS